MFTPIKNLLTYIQKNATGLSSNGATKVTSPTITSAPVAPASARAMDVTKKNVSTFEVIKASIQKEHEQKSDKMMNTEVANKASELTSSENSTSTEKVCPIEAEKSHSNNAASTSNSMNNNNFDDDFELQIKSSILLRKQPVETNDDLPRRLPLKRTERSDEQNHKDLQVDHDFKDFQSVCVSNNNNKKNNVTTSPTTHFVIEDFCALGNFEREDTHDEFFTDEEDLEGPFLAISQAQSSISGRVKLSDGDLSSSIENAAPTDDPLAIDDFVIPNASAEMLTLDSSINDEASTSGDFQLLWMDDIDGFNSSPSSSKSIKPSMTGHNQTKDTIEATTPTSIAQRLPNGRIFSESNTNIAHKKGLISEENVGEEIPSDGCDSGLGSETSTLQITLTGVTDNGAVSNSALQSHENNQLDLVASPSTSTSSETPPPHSVTIHEKPLRSNLKRRLHDDDTLVGDTLASSMSTKLQQKKLKRSINFDSVQIFYFPRQQGFGCVPSVGGCTLGMSARHVSSKTLTLAEHAAELRRAHRLQLAEINPRASSSEDSDESEEDYLSEGSGSDLDAESNGFLQPVTPKQRRALLKAAGVRKIDATEKSDCRNIRNSREVCGCTCRDFCDPETCACSLAGIKCQVDRAMFPCGCSRDACGNAAGRLEFNADGVRIHFIHTIMRLGMENRQPSSVAASTSSFVSVVSASDVVDESSVSANHYYGMTQPSQSTYSSGYASPTYANDPETTISSYYQPTSIRVAVPAAEIHQPAPYPLDSLDASLFTGATNTTPSYAELMPAYGAVSATAATSSVYHHSLNYDYTNGQQVSSYSSGYHHQPPTNNYLAANHATTTNIAYSSCAVPSIPPYGTATTATAITQYHHHESNNPGVATDTSTSSSSVPSIDDGGSGSSFISLNTPVASSSRLLQINDLLQHNRNTTAALVAVTQCSTNGISNSSSRTVIDAATQLEMTSSIDTPPIEETHKSAMAFEELRSPLYPTPIVAVLNDIISVNNTDEVSDYATSTPPIKLPSSIVVECPNPHLPSAVSPNGDGQAMNDFNTSATGHLS